MWSYVMAAARGDPRRRPGSVFTVQSANCGPGPCRDGLNCSRYPLNSGYKSATFQKDGISRGFSRDELDTTLSRDGSRDVLAEVRVHTPYSERCHSPSDTPFTQPLQKEIQWIQIGRSGRAAMDTGYLRFAKRLCETIMLEPVI
ncbi:hypothetical protein GEV33_006304 [Tenebrio molitor]|uniref:Uncharacterized protein n=1 Tax=Tenebrio molitor TaxID=7067 RepID=A0A8J6LK72_TENMO|nr:hypothetical protein GEV33_006304 [Tenebrio molitor]